MTTLPPYDPDKHQALPPEPSILRNTIEVLALFVVFPFIACGVVWLAIDVIGFWFFVIGVALAVGGLFYGVRNVDKIRWLDDEDDEA